MLARGVIIRWVINNCCLVGMFTSRSASTTPSGSPRTSQQNVYNPPDVSTWNPFDDDNFSKLTAEELLNKDFAKLGDGRSVGRL